MRRILFYSAFYSMYQTCSEEEKNDKLRLVLHQLRGYRAEVYFLLIRRNYVIILCGCFFSYTVINYKAFFCRDLQIDKKIITYYRRDEN